MDWTHLSPAPLDTATLQRVRTVVMADAQKPVTRSWRRDLRTALFATSGFTLLAILVIGVTAGWAHTNPAARLVTVGLLALVQLTGVVAALAPRAKRLQIAALTLAPIALTALVALRPDIHSHAPTPIVVCTLSHVMLAMLPLVMGLRRLRRAAITPLRAASLGAGIGTVGTIVGEFACGHGAAHVATYHVPAWILVCGIALFAARRMRSETFAP